MVATKGISLGLDTRRMDAKLNFKRSMVATRGISPGPDTRRMVAKLKLKGSKVANLKLKGSMLQHGQFQH